MRKALLLNTILFLLAASTASAVGGGDIEFKPVGVDPVQFSHDFHSKARGLKCAACHFQKFSKGQGTK